MHFKKEFMVRTEVDLETGMLLVTQKHSFTVRGHPQDLRGGNDQCLECAMHLHYSFPPLYPQRGHAITATFCRGGNGGVHEGSIGVFASEAAAQGPAMPAELWGVHILSTGKPGHTYICYCSACAESQHVGEAKSGAGRSRDLGPQTELTTVTHTPNVPQS